MSGLQKNASLYDIPKVFSDLSGLSMCISKRIKWILKKSHREKFFFCIFLKSTHQVDMKNVVECQKEFFAYFNALETRGVLLTLSCGLTLFQGTNSVGSI